MKSSKDNMIHIGPDYALQGDTFCITLLKRRVVKKTGSVQWDAIAYCDNLEQTLHRLIDKDIGSINNLQDIANRIVELKKYVSDVVQNVAPESIIGQSKHFNDKYDQLDKEWQTIRSFILKRDNYTCQKCKSKLRSNQLSVHHIMARKEGGKDGERNLITLCSPCHDWAEAQEDLTWDKMVKN